MQYEENDTKPESNRKYLVQQVEEQSDLCDVIVKMGYWEKKFHRCVLVASPFFDNVLKNNFLEKQTGKIDIKLGTPTTLEMAIMFLYGKRPKLSHDNIEHVLHLAEFLLIPNLKSACVSWLETTNVAEENCMTLLQLSSIYDFEIPNCTEYIEAHLSEMLRHSQMVNLTKESIEYLFSDRKLSYVPMDEKLIFLLRWRDSQPDERNVYMKELLSAIDFYDVTNALLQELKEEHSLKENIDFEQVLGNINNELGTHRVLIMKSGSSDGHFWCLDLEREKWFRVNSRAYEEESSYSYNDISGTGSNDFEIYFVDKGYQQTGILTLNLQLDTCKTFKLVEEDSGNDLKQIVDLQMHGDTCIVNVNERVKMNKQKKQTSQAIDMHSRLRNMSLLECIPLDQTHATQVMQDDWGFVSNVYTDTSTLYFGNVDDEVVKMSPLLTFKDYQIRQICVNSNLSVAMLFKAMKFISIFDLADHTLERLQVETDYGDNLVQSEDGFVIYNNKRCICLQRLTGPSLPTKYTVKEILFLNTEFTEKKFYFCDNTWYRYYCKSYNEKFKFESTPHSCIMSEGSMDSATWKPLPLPKEASRCYGSTMRDRLFQICLPKIKLRCDIECPHCKVASMRTTTRVSSDDDSDDYYYEDYSDEEYYGYPFYDASNSDYNNDSSDSFD